MKKTTKVFLISHLLFFGIFCYHQKVQAQNLVDNWSFEDTTICPPGLGQIQSASGWVSNSGSPDYFNECNQGIGTGPLNVNVPLNVLDFQYAKSGVAYSGLLTYSTIVPNVREYMGTQLNQTLQIGQRYFVSFYVSRAVNHTPNFRIDVANNKIGVQFTTYSQVPPNAASPNNISQVYTDSIITDTLNWVQIKGSFVADSNYQYISLGNFFNGTNTQYIDYDTLYTVAYYYLDDVCVSPDSLFCDLLSGISQPITEAHISVFPNPARDWIVVGGNGIISLKIFDVSGREKNSFYQVITPFKIDVSHLAIGIYIVQIKTKNGYSFQKIILNH